MSANVDAERRAEGLERLKRLLSDIIRVISRLERALGSDAARAFATRKRARRSTLSVNAPRQSPQHPRVPLTRCVIEARARVSAFRRDSLRPLADSGILHSAPAKRIGALAATCLKFVDLGQFPSPAQRALVAPGSRIALSHGIRYPAPYRRCLSLARISILCRSLGRTADTRHNFPKMDSNRSMVVFEPRDRNRPDDPRTPVTDRVWRRDDSLGG